MSQIEKWVISIANIGTVMLVLISLPITTNMLYTPLKKQYPAVKSDILKEINVVVVLRGGDDYSRIIQGILSFKNSRASILVLSGYTGDCRSKNSESDIWKLMAIKLGVPPEAIRTECISQNTYEHPLEVLKISGIDKDTKIGIVTSSWHVPRAVGEFQRHFRNVFPIPVEYKFKNLDWYEYPLFPQTDALNWSTIMLREYMGLIWYKFKNRLSSYYD